MDAMLRLAPHGVIAPPSAKFAAVGRTLSSRASAATLRDMAKALRTEA
ncbi:hypothetical protein N185_11600 [Sinorhizobium sp. GW3]|nr:hypothetical protein N185_11600 [Sinorhizobium sp. GW3]